MITLIFFFFGSLSLAKMASEIKFYLVPWVPIHSLKNLLWSSGFQFSWSENSPVLLKVVEDLKELLSVWVRAVGSWGRLVLVQEQPRGQWAAPCHFVIGHSRSTDPVKWGKCSKWELFSPLQSQLLNIYQLSTHRICQYLSYQILN